MLKVSLFGLYACFIFSLVSCTKYISAQGENSQSSKDAAQAQAAQKIIDGMLAESAKNSYELNANAVTIPLSEKKKSIINGELTIAAGESVVIDSDLDVGTLIVNGSLACSNQLTTNYKLKVGTIHINGYFECGASETSRFTGKLSILLKDSATTSAVRRAIMISRGGQLRLFGADSKVNWTRLSATASVGSTTLVLDNAIARGWQAGDKIVVGPSGYNPYEAETLDLVSVGADGRTLKVAQALKYNHWGTIQTFQGKTGPVQLDERAEVANLNRNILIAADESTGVITEQNGIGGHVMVMAGGATYIDAVEFSKMGQAGFIGRYPFHWHMAGDVYGQFVRNSSIHHSFQRCLTVHATQRALVQNNVCYDYRGHGYFLEDGDEIDNVIIGNLAIFGRRQFPDKVLIDSDRGGSFAENRASAMSGFWISHPRNIVRDNVVSGTEGTGFWMSFITGDTPNTNGRIINQQPVTVNGQQIVPRPTKTNTTDFSNNVAHTNVVGINWDAAPGTENANNPRNPNDKLLTSAYYTPPSTPTFSNLSIYKNRITGMYFRGSTAIFDRSIFADNGWNVFVAYNQVISNSTIIGRSNNHDANDEKYMYVDGMSWGQQPVALVLYDGPAELLNVNLINFATQKNIKYIHGVEYDVTSTLFYDIGGHNRYENLFSNLYISPTPIYKFSSGFRKDVEKNNYTTGWYDITNGAHAKDLDGSLTGRPGAIIVPKNDFINYAGCTSEVGYDNFVVCDGQRKVSSMYLAVNNSFMGGGGVPFLVYRNDGPSSIPVNQPAINLDRSFDAIMGTKATGMNNKFSMLAGYEYSIIFRRDDVVNDFRKSSAMVHLQFSSESLGDVSPVIRFSGLGSQCRVNGARAFASLGALRAQSDTGYFAVGNDLYTKFKANARDTMTVGSSRSQQAIATGLSISCDSLVKPQVMGYYDMKLANGRAVVSGWACDQTVNESIGLHFYVKNTSGPEQFISSTLANLPNETQVLSACGVYKGSYRFSAELTPELTRQYAGKELILYGLSKSGGVNSAITPSGSVIIPNPGAAPAPAPTATPAPVPAPPVATPVPVPTPVSGQPVCKRTGSFMSGGSVVNYACECTGDMSSWTYVGGGCYHKAAAAAPTPTLTPTPVAAKCANGAFLSGTPSAAFEWMCSCTSADKVYSKPGWGAKGENGCQYRKADYFCGNGKKTFFVCELSTGVPEGTGWSNVGSGCYHYGSAERCP